MGAEIKVISLDDLQACWRTLRATADNYQSFGGGAVTLIEACRLIEVEIRQQYPAEADAVIDRLWG